MIANFSATPRLHLPVVFWYSVAIFCPSDLISKPVSFSFRDQTCFDRAILLWIRGNEQRKNCPLPPIWIQLPPTIQKVPQQHGSFEAHLVPERERHQLRNQVESAEKASEYQHTTGKCNLRVAEKLAIIRADKRTSLNKRSGLL